MPQERAIPNWPLRAGVLCAAVVAASALVFRDAAPDGPLPFDRSPPRIGEIARAQARLFAIDEDLVLRIIAVESRGDPSARSKRGALGLMQLMPATAKQLAGELGMGVYDLARPLDNIRLGSYYVSKLQKQFGGDAQLMVAAYHTGDTRVRRWRREAPKGATGREIVLTRASRATRWYVDQVLEGYEGPHSSARKRRFPASVGISDNHHCPPPAAPSDAKSLSCKDLAPPA